MSKVEQEGGKKQLRRIELTFVPVTNVSALDEGALRRSGRRWRDEWLVVEETGLRLICDEMRLRRTVALWEKRTRTLGEEHAQSGFVISHPLYQF